MKVSVFGMGYVGCVTASCLAQDGHTVVGVEVDPKKLDQIRRGASPIVEPGLDELLSSMVRAERLTVTNDTRQAIQDTDVSFVCVGTPSNGNGSLKFHYAETVCREIGSALRDHSRWHVVVIRSTVLPGTVQTRLIPALESCSGRRRGHDFGVCMNPEFMRESSAIADYYHPSHIVIGELEERSGDVVRQLYSSVAAPVIRTTIVNAEMLKYVNNAFHALKITFANEIGNLCKALGTDGREVMDIFCQDRKLNISSVYLKPGFGFGGSCLPKDLRALLYRAKERDLECPLLSAVLESNQQQVQRGIELVENTGRKKVGVLGLSFKAGTDDVRESPIVPLVETLVGRGYQVSIYDGNVDLSKLIGANKLFLQRELPHIASLMRPSIDEVVEHSEVVVVANGNIAFHRVPQLMRHDQILIDLVGIATRNEQVKGAYEGICW